MRDAKFSRNHEKLGEGFFVPVQPAAFPEAILRYRNQSAARSVGLDELDDAAWVRHFGRFEPFEGSFPAPLALCYHGHQFGHYNPDLGDGRGFLFAQLEELNTGRLLDLGTKGSGQTPFSRTADGRLTLKGAVREILATEMLTALQVPTSKTFSVIETGESLSRHDEPSPTRSAVLVRLSHSHIRIGSFQRLAYQQQPEAIIKLMRYVMAQYYPHLPDNLSDGEAAEALLADFSARVAKMTAGWMVAGFVHGVLNTDNFNLTGESFDYGPWRFLPLMDPSFTAAYFDQQSRYAYGRQPEAALWALCRFADSLAMVAPAERLQEVLAAFYPQLETEMAASLRWRLGLCAVDAEAGLDFTAQFFRLAKETKAPFDDIFYYGYAGENAGEYADGYAEKLGREWEGLLSAEAPRQSALPAFFTDTGEGAGPASLVIDEVERVWHPIAADDDWRALEAKLQQIRAYGAALAAP